MAEMISISPNVFIDPVMISAIEQINGEIWVYVEGRPYSTTLNAVDLLDSVQMAKKEYKQFWAGR